MSQLFSKQTFIVPTHGNLVSVSHPKKLTDPMVRKAVANAFAYFALTHPEWVDSLFDQFFVDRYLLPQIKMNLSQNRLITPLDVAMEWDAQFGFGTEKSRAKWIDELQQAAESFVHRLKHELHHV